MIVVSGSSMQVCLDSNGKAPKVGIHAFCKVLPTMDEIVGFGEILELVHAMAVEVVTPLIVGFPVVVGNGGFCMLALPVCSSCIPVF